ncbi:MAG: methyl-accepting chemotaxis protein [Ruminiclostridium sp.]|nr:methyl-accepting chemotaxis protein [Ruminiclostridium sp.]
MKRSVESLIRTNTLLVGGISCVLFIAALIGGIVGSCPIALIAGIVGILFSIGGSVFVLSSYKNNIVAPLDRISEFSEKIKAGNYSDTVKISTGYNIDNTAEALNTTAELNKFVSEVISDIANGDFTRDVSKLPDDYALTSGLKELYYNMAKAFSDISKGAEKVDHDGQRVSTASQTLSQGVSSQAGTVDTLSNTVNDIRQAVIKNAENAREAQRNADAASTAVTEGTEKMNELLKAMDDISNSTNEISKLNKVIEDIAFQTNILALNASVEAARAGEAGKGFAVVASEVKNLAVKSQDASHSTSTVIQSCVESVKEGVEKTRETASYFSIIAEKASEIGKGLVTITEECEQQSEAITQINIGVDRISGVIQSTSMTADECAASAAELTGRSGDLREIVGRFKFGDFRLPEPKASKAKKAAPKPAVSASAAAAPKPAAAPAPKPVPAAKPAPAAKSNYTPAPKPAPASAPKAAAAPVPKPAYTPAPKPSGAPSPVRSSGRGSSDYSTAEFVDVPDNKY